MIFCFICTFLRQSVYQTGLSLLQSYLHIYVCVVIPLMIEEFSHDYLKFITTFSVTIDIFVEFETISLATR
jgi:hypothetical protein